MQNIDVEKIMEEIRAEIKEKGYKPEDLDFSDIAVEVSRVNPEEGYNEGELLGQLAFLNSHYNNPIYFPLQGNPVKVFLQKVVRRVLLFVIFPGFQFQNRFNVGTVRTLNQVKNYMEENAAGRELVKDLHNLVEVQQKKLAAQKKELEELKNELEQLKEMIAGKKEEEGAVK